MRLNFTKGMSLIEVMIALTIISVGVLAVCSAVISSMTFADANRQETIALHYARAAMSSLEAAQNSGNNFNNIFSKCAPGGTDNPFDVTVFDPLDVSSDTDTLINITTGTDTSTDTGSITNSNRTAFYGRGYIYFPVKGNYPDPLANDHDMLSYYGPMQYQYLVGHDPVTHANLYNTIPTNIPPPSVASMGQVVISNGVYTLLPVTVRIAWQDLKTGDPNNSYIRFVDYQGLLAQLHQP